MIERVKELKLSELNGSVLKDICELGNQAYLTMGYPEPFNFDLQKNLWMELLKNGTGVVFVLPRGKDIDGILLGFYTSNLDNGEKISIEVHWYVKENKRGNGLYLLRAFEKWSKQNQCKRIYIGGSKSLESFYSRLGYKMKPEPVVYQKEI